MKKLLLIALAAIAMFSFNSCKKDDGGDDPKPQPGGTTVRVDQVGTLEALLTKQNLRETSTLTVIGVLGNEDLKTLRGMSTLNTLDLTQVAITSLPEDCFSESKLQEIKLPQTLIEIQKNAFSNCKNLTTITLGVSSQLKTIGGGERTEGSFYVNRGAFYNCSALKTIDIPSSVEVMGCAVFEGCSSLETVNFATNSKLKTLDGTFYECTSLKSITIPASVTTLFWTFVGCSSLASVDFGSSSQLENIDTFAFFECTSLKSISIPASVTTLNLAFPNCSNLETVTFKAGSKLKTMNEAFWGCSALTTVDFGTTSQLEIMGNIFNSCTSLKSITIPASVTTLDRTFSFCTSLETITFKAGSKLKTIGKGTFGSDSDRSLTTIDASNCANITNIAGLTNSFPALKTLKIGTRIPAQVSGFTYPDPDATVLYVPAGCVTAYKNADFWKEFANIKEL